MGSFVKLGRFKIIFTDYQNYKGYQKSVYQIIKNQIKVTKITVNQILGNQIAGQSQIKLLDQCVFKLCLLRKITLGEFNFVHPRKKTHIMMVSIHLRCNALMGDVMATF